jgi:hypothetical protein
MITAIELINKTMPIGEIYSNSTNRDITVDLDDWTNDETINISIYSLQGNKLFDQVIRQKVTTLNLQLQPGVYHYMIKSKHQSRSAKLIIL